MQMERTPTDERLRWFLHRAELLINSRPLVRLPQDPAAETITPNDLLLGSSTGLKEESEAGVLPEDYTAARDEEIQRFWEQWTNAYLPTISARTKWTGKTINLKPGDVVFICDGEYRRGWRKGVIEEAYMDQESQQVRQVVVRTADGTKYRRGAAKVAPIIRT